MYFYNADCLEIMKHLQDHTIDLIVTDPPYQIYTTGGGMYLQDDKKYVKELGAISNGFSEEILDQMCRLMKKINIYLFCSQKQIIPLLDYFVTRRGCNYNIISWHKTNPIPACGNKYLTDTEYILFFRERGVKIYGNYKTKKTWYATPLNVADKKKYDHPTIKPVDILQNLIVNSSKEGELVLDPFMGVGSTGVACKHLGRDFVGIEIDKTYYDTAVERIGQE